MKIARALIFLILFLYLCCLFTVGVGAEEGEIKEGRAVVLDGALFLIEGEQRREFESLNELVSSLSEGYTLTLDGIREKSLELRKDITIRGNAHFEEGLSVAEDTSLNLVGAEISFSSPIGIEIKGGSLTVSDSIINASGIAISLERFSSSRLFMTSGSISAGGVAIRINNGSCYLGGGVVSGVGECAVDNRDTLTLFGSVAFKNTRFSVVTTDPVSLSNGGKSYLGELSLKQSKSFFEGEIYNIARNASIEQIERIKTYDVNNCLYDLKYLSAELSGIEAGSLCVYLPFDVSFCLLGEGEKRTEALLGSLVSTPDFSVPEGFYLGSWYLDEAMSREYDFSTPVTSDLKLYSKLELSSPSFSLNSYEGVYNGKAQSVDFSCLSHPLEGEGIYSFVWQDGEGCDIAYSRALKLCDASDSGSYRCKIIFTVGAYKSECFTPYITVDILKASIPIPKIPEVTFDGSLKLPFLGNEMIVYGGYGFTEAGEYPLTLTLSDPDNYCFEDGSESVGVLFKILKAKNSWTAEPRISDFFLGEKPYPKAKAAYGEVEFFYSLYPEGEYKSAPPTGTGVYYMRAVVPESANYLSLESEPIKFTVLSERVEEIWVERLPDRVEYYAFCTIDKSGMVVKARYDSGREEEIAPSLLSVRYQTAQNLRYLDTGVILEYSGASVFLPLSVLRVDYEMPEAPSDISVVFDGEFHRPSYECELPIGLDGSSPSYKISGGGLSAGEYEIVISFESGSKNYNTPKSVSYKLTVLPREVEVLWGGLEFVYDGSLKLPEAHFYSVYGEKKALTVNGAAISAGDNYTATAALADKNYILHNSEAVYKISKASYDLSGVKWTATGFVYNGESHSVTLIGLPEGVRAIGYADNSAKEAGEYIASVILSYDTQNYNVPEIQPYKWRIEKGEYDLSGISFSDKEAVYDGKIHYPAVSGAFILGKDGSLPSFSFSGGALNVADGRVTVAITFSTDSKNYNAPRTVYRTVLIKPLGISVTWGGRSFTYNGEVFCPSAASESISLRVEGGARGAGEYTARAYSLDPNYYVINSSISYTISKAENRFTQNPKVGNIFSGQSPSPTASAVYGNTEFLYYSDKALTKPVSLPLEVGEYYLVCTVSEGDNYLALRSEPFSFKVMPILPVGITVSLTDRAFTAFESLLSTDFTCLIINNDGSVKGAPSEEVTVIYPSGECLLAGEMTVLFRYGGFEASRTISVGKAALDLSGVYWEGSEQVYDGTEKSAVLAGLPVGVEVKEYKVSSALDAGEYTLCAILQFDEANYLDPGEIYGSLKILKAPLSPSVKNSPFFDGEPKLPVPTSELYSFLPEGEYINAGQYKVKVVLNSQNYCLTEDFVDFVINPAPLTVRVEGAEIYWLEDEPIPDFEVISGILYGGDKEKISTLISNGKATATLNDPNYALTVIEGEVVYKARFSPRVTKAILVSLLLFLIIALMTLAIVKKKIRPIALIEGIRRERSLKEPGKYIPKPIEPLVAPADTELPEGLAIDAERAENMLTDQAARTLIRKCPKKRVEGFRRAIVNVGALNDSYAAGEVVDIESLKEKGLIQRKAGFVKILAEGSISKPLTVYADAFSLSAVKMIALAGGSVNKTNILLKYSCKKEEKEL